MIKEFLLVREATHPAKGDKEGFTRGALSFEGKPFCFTVEDEDRHLETHPEAKIHGKTCIPRGHYRITVSFSHHFGKLLPEILNVPNYSGIRAHGGNKAENSEGCLICGRVQTPDGVAQCAPVIQRMIDTIQSVEEEGGECWIKII